MKSGAGLCQATVSLKLCSCRFPHKFAVAIGWQLSGNWSGNGVATVWQLVAANGGSYGGPLQTQITATTAGAFEPRIATTTLEPQINIKAAFKGRLIGS